MNLLAELVNAEGMKVTKALCFDTCSFHMVLSKYFYGFLLYTYMYVGNSLLVWEYVFAMPYREISVSMKQIEIYTGALPR